jgi:glycosyltransferase involved in cell wall biosynthesis
MTRKKKQNIVIAIESFFDGGAEMFAIRLANELSKTRKIYFIELYPYLTKEKSQLCLLDLKRIRLIQPGRNFMGDRLYRDGFNERNLPTGTSGALEKVYRLFKKIQIKFFIKRHNIKVVNSHSWDTDVYFALLKNEIDFKLVSSFHGHYAFLEDKRANYEARTKFTLNAVDAIVFTAPEHQKTLDNYEIPASKRHKIFYGVNLSHSREITRYEQGDCLNLVMAARGIKEKGWEEAIQAVLIVLKYNPGLVKLNLVGKGEWLDFLKDKYKDPAISFLNYQNDVIETVNAAHVGILPSYYIAESLPNTIIEYLFCSKPVITTNIGAIKEMISADDELAGICIEMENDKVNVAAIAAAIENYIIKPELVERDSQIALAASVKFTMNTCVENYLDVFRKVSDNTQQAIIGNGIYFPKQKIVS